MTTSIKTTRSKPVTALGLRSLTAADKGRSVNFGASVSGQVHVGKDGTVSVHATWRYRVGGKTREIRLGTWREGDGMSLKAIRDERDRLAADLRLGIDPIERKAAERLKVEAEQAEARLQLSQRAAAAEATAADLGRRITLRQLFDRWKAVDLQPQIGADGRRVGRKDGGKYTEEQFGRYVFPALGDVAVADVRKADLMSILDSTKAAGKRRTSNILLTDLKQMFRFALARDIVDRNPLDTVTKRDAGGTDGMRQRVLSPDEIRMLARNIPAAGMNKRSEIAIWLLLGTGARVGELMGSVWATQGQDLTALAALPEAADVKVGVVDMAARTWYLPTTKNERDHTIHLSDFALDQFKTLFDLREHGPDGSALPWVFPNTGRTGPVCVKSFGKQLGDRQRPAEQRMKGRSKNTCALAVPGGKWTAHDLRRTAGTLMASLGISGDVIDECLNHVIESRVRRTYIRDRRPLEQARAFDALGDKLRDLVRGEAAPSNVVPMRAA